MHLHIPKGHTVEESIENILSYGAAFILLGIAGFILVWLGVLFYAVFNYFREKIKGLTLAKASCSINPFAAWIRLLK